MPDRRFFSCSSCLDLFNTRDEAANHAATGCRPTCPLCEFRIVFTNADALEAHYSKSHNRGLFSCAEPRCRQRFVSRSAYEGHRNRCGLYFKELKRSARLDSASGNSARNRDRGKDVRSQDARRSSVREPRNPHVASNSGPQTKRQPRESTKTVKNQPNVRQSPVVQGRKSKRVCLTPFYSTWCRFCEKVVSDTFEGMVLHCIDTHGCFYLCHFCGHMDFEKPTERHFGHHSQVEPANSRFGCMFCKLRKRKKDDIKQHIRAEHGNLLRTLSCKIPGCFAVFPSEKCLDRHRVVSGHSRIAEAIAKSERRDQKPDLMRNDPSVSEASTNVSDSTAEDQPFASNSSPLIAAEILLPKNSPPSLAGSSKSGGIDNKINNDINANVNDQVPPTLKQESSSSSRFPGSGDPQGYSLKKESTSASLQQSRDNLLIDEHPPEKRSKFEVNRAEPDAIHHRSQSHFASSSIPGNFPSSSLPRTNTQPSLMTDSVGRNVCDTSVPPPPLPPTSRCYNRQPMQNMPEYDLANPSLLPGVNMGLPLPPPPGYSRQFNNGGPNMTSDSDTMSVPTQVQGSSFKRPWFGSEGGPQQFFDGPLPPRPEMPYLPPPLLPGIVGGKRFRSDPLRGQVPPSTKVPVGSTEMGGNDGLGPTGVKQGSVPIEPSLSHLQHSDAAATANNEPARTPPLIQPISAQAPASPPVLLTPPIPEVIRKMPEVRVRLERINQVPSSFTDRESAAGSLDLQQQQQTSVPVPDPDFERDQPSLAPPQGFRTNHVKPTPSEVLQRKRRKVVTNESRILTPEPDRLVVEDSASEESSDSDGGPAFPGLTSRITRQNSAGIFKSTTSRKRSCVNDSNLVKKSKQSTRRSMTSRATQTGDVWPCLKCDHREKRIESLKHICKRAKSKSLLVLREISEVYTVPDAV